MNEDRYNTTFNPPVASRVTRTKDIGGLPRIGDFVLTPSRYAFWLGMLKGGGGYLCAATLFIWCMQTLSLNDLAQVDYKLIYLAGLFFAIFYGADLGIGWLSDRAAAYEEASRAEETETREDHNLPRPSMGNIEPARVKGPAGTAVIRQSRPGSFRTLAREVLDPTRRVMFSTRAAAHFGLDLDEMVGELRRAGILHNTAVRNGSPELTAEGRIALRCFVDGDEYPPRPNA